MEQKPNFLIDSDGTKIWYLDVLFHRTDGPAVIHANGEKEYWINGDYYPDFNEYVKVAKWTDEQIVMYKLKHF